MKRNKALITLLSALAVCIAGQQQDPWLELFNRAERLQSQRDFNGARSTLQSAIESAADSSWKRALAYSNLGAVAQYEGRFLEAEKHYRQAILCWRMAGEAHAIPMAGTLHNLASLLNEINRLPEAEHILVQVESIYGQHPSMATSTAAAITFRNHASLCMWTRKYREAEALYRRAQNILETKGAEAAWELGQVHRDLGDLLQRGSRQAARAEYETARGLWEASLRQSTPVSPTSYLNLAILYANLDEENLARSTANIGLKAASGDPHQGAILLLYLQLLRRTGAPKSEIRSVEKQVREAYERTDINLSGLTVSAPVSSSATKSLHPKPKHRPAP